MRARVKDICFVSVVLHSSSLWPNWVKYGDFAGFFFFPPHLFLSFCDVISSSTICFSYCSSLFPSLPSFFTVLTQYLSYDYRPYFQYINIGRKVMNSFQFHFCNDNMRSSVDTCPTNWWKTTEKKTIQSLWKWHIANEETQIQEDLLTFGRNKVTKARRGTPWWSTGWESAC